MSFIWQNIVETQEGYTTVISTGIPVPSCPGLKGQNVKGKSRTWNFARDLKVLVKKIDKKNVLKLKRGSGNKPQEISSALL